MTADASSSQEKQSLINWSAQLAIWSGTRSLMNSLKQKKRWMDCDWRCKWTSQLAMTDDSFQTWIERNELNLNAFMCTFAGYQKWAFQQEEEAIAGVPQTCVLSGLTQASFTLICVVILLSNLNKDGIKWINRAVITVIISHLGLGMHSSSDCFLNTI